MQAIILNLSEVSLNKLCLLPFVFLTMSAAEVTGHWSGMIEVADSDSGGTIRTPVDADFEQAGSNFSGKISRQGDTDQVAIKNGKVQGNNVSFEAASGETVTPMKFELSLEGDRMKGEMKGSVDTGPIVGKVSLVRKKP